MRKIEISVTPHPKVTEHQIVPGPDQTSPCKGNLETIILIIIIAIRGDICQCRNCRRQCKVFCQRSKFLRKQCDLQYK